MNTTTALLIGFAAGFLAALVASKVLKFIIGLLVLGGLGLLGYLRFSN